MKLLIDFNHPADVHLFKNFIFEMQKKGHKFKLIARDKDVTHQLLDSFKLKYEKRKGYKGILKIPGMFLIDFKLLKIARKFDPDILIGATGDCYISQVGWLLGKPSFIFDDTEHKKIQNLLTFPFATKVITPQCSFFKLGNKQVKYPGYHQSAYLHSKWFKPDKSIFKNLKIAPGTKYVIVRFVSWDANHDINQKGIQDKKKLIQDLEKNYKVFITSETNLDPFFDKYLLKIPSDKIHSVLYFSEGCITEGATTAAEAGVLGIQSVYLNSLKLGYIEDLRKKGLILSKIPKTFKKRKKIEIFDLTKWMVKKIENLNHFKRLSN